MTVYTCTCITDTLRNALFEQQSSSTWEYVTKLVETSCKPPISPTLVQIYYVINRVELRANNADSSYYVDGLIVTTYF